MNSDIEKLLRKAPGFTPPAGLRERLIEQIPPNHSLPQPSILSPASGGWLRRWWPALAPAAVSVACAVVLTAQQGKIRELRASNQALAQAAATTELAVRSRNATEPAQTDPAGTQQEILRLRELASQLKSEISQLNQLQTENVKLRTQLAAPPELNLTPEELEALAKEKEKAISIACINNLKQFGLAVRV